MPCKEHSTTKDAKDAKRYLLILWGAGNNQERSHKKGGRNAPRDSAQFCPRGLHELTRISSGQRVKEGYDLFNLLRCKLFAELVLRHL